MCGIAGIASTAGPVALAELQAMAAALRHRGPDDEGFWKSGSGLIGFAHRRLSIIDLSPAGHQPMRSANGRFWITFNGEIYNFQSLRKKLDAAAPQQWRGHSDTEILLAGFEQWGVQETLLQADGMFAFAAWSEADGLLYLARDRLGEKPLYLGCFEGRLAFASEMRALHTLRRKRPQLDPAGIDSFLRFGYVRSDRPVLKDVAQLPPGRLLTMQWPPREVPCLPALLSQARPYWLLSQAARQGLGATPPGSAAEAADKLESLLGESIRQRMVADVPVGAFLSGGIDSSTVVALMQTRSTRAVKTFSIGFAESAYNEAHHAKAVARHLQTDHTEFLLTAADAIALIPTLAGVYDEPFADASQLPTVMLARLARREVTVALSGDGGDELFGGYQRYRTALALHGLVRRIPLSLRRGCAALLCHVRPPPVLSMPYFRAQRLAERAAAGDIDAMRVRFLDRSPPAGSPSGGPGSPAEGESAIPGFVAHPLQRQMYADQIDYLPDDILVKLDRATMAAGLEGRVPLLDHRLVEFSWTLPASLLLSGGRSKAPLRDVLTRYVPAALIDRPKQGFDIPLAEWLRGPLREWAGALVQRSAMILPGTDTERISGAWRKHSLGQIDASHYLWNILMLSSWAGRVLERD